MLFSKLRFLYLVVALILFGSCASIDTNKVAPGYVEAFKAIKDLITGIENVIEPDIIERIPYASILVKIGKGPEALMILENIDQEDYVWVSADGVYLVINNGKIIQTYGLPNNLKEKLSPTINWDEDIYENKEFISYNSYNSPALNNLKVISKYTDKGKENIELTFNTKNLNLIEEKINSNDIGWSKTNFYWVDENNFVWKSIQNISPKLPEIYIEVAKKPR
jgi:hypothetical protein